MNEQKNQERNVSLINNTTLNHKSDVNILIN